MTHRRPARRAAALLALGLTALAIGAAPAVLGHAALLTAEPADDATLSGSPAEIVMTFTQNLDPARSSIRVVDAAGTAVAEGGRVDPGDDVRTMRLALTTPLAPGTYSVRWTSFSAEDSEQERGTTTFTIVAATPAPTEAPSAGASAAATTTPSAPSPAPSPSPAPAPSSPAASTADVLIPIVAVLVVLAGLGLWLLRDRSRGAS